jgi:hypothetical protein
MSLCGSFVLRSADSTMSIRGAAPTMSLRSPSTTVKLDSPTTTMNLGSPSATVKLDSRFATMSLHSPSVTMDLSLPLDVQQYVSWKLDNRHNLGESDLETQYKYMVYQAFEVSNLHEAIDIAMSFIQKSAYVDCLIYITKQGLPQNVCNILARPLQRPDPELSLISAGVSIAFDTEIFLIISVSEVIRLLIDLPGYTFTFLVFRENAKSK